MIFKYNIAFLMHGARNIGGGEYSIFYLIRNLNRDIFNPIVFFANENEIIRKLQKEGIETIKIPLHSSITSVYRDSIKYNPISLFLYFWYLLSAIFKIRHFLKRSKVDLLHPHDNLSKIIGGIAAKTGSIKIVAHCRDALGNDLIGRILKMVYLLLTDRVISVSEKTAEFLMTSRILKGKIKVIYNGVDLNLFRADDIKGNARRELGIPDDCIVIEIIAVLETYKGHRYLFHALKMLKENGISNIRCLVIGEGRERNALIETVKNLDISDEVIFLGYRKDIPYLLGSADILAIPSIGQEAFPRVAIEAMAMRVPVICTDFGGLPEAVVDGETGVIVPTMDTDALSKAIVRLIKNPEEREKMGEAGRKRAEENFSIESNVRKTEELYSDILSVQVK